MHVTARSLMRQRTVKPKQNKRREKKRKEGSCPEKQVFVFECDWSGLPPAASVCTVKSAGVRL